MANGIMTGSGTQDSPYLVSDVYDFCAINDGETYSGNYFKLTSDIDFNDHETYKNGISAAIISRDSAILDGDGHKISNMTFSSTAQKIKFSSINNVEFVFVTVQAVTNNSAQIYAPTFNNCNFGFFLSGSNMGCIFGTNGSFIDCKFNLKGTSPQSWIGKINFNRCHINFVDFTHTDAAIFSSNVGNFVFRNSYITGTVTANNLDKILYSCTLINSFLALKISSTKSYYTVENCICTATSFIDKELLQNALFPSLTYLHYLTTSQCMDNAYLQSIGYPAFPAFSAKE